MSQIYFENKLVEVIEDRHISSFTQSKVNGKTIEIKSLEIKVESSTHTYDDGVELYLNFDHISEVGGIIPSIYFPDCDLHKILLTVSNNCELKIKRINKDNFFVNVLEIIYRILDIACDNYKKFQNDSILLLIVDYFGDNNNFKIYLKQDFLLKVMNNSRSVYNMFGKYDEKCDELTTYIIIQIPCNVGLFSSCNEWIL